MQLRKIVDLSIKVWKRMYDLVQELGQTLHDSRPTYTELGDYIAPKITLPREHQAMLEDEIHSTMQRCNSYLDRCGMRIPKPLWVYDRKNPETHASAQEFKYRHLMESAT